MTQRATFIAAAFCCVAAILADAAPLSAQITAEERAEWPNWPLLVDHVPADWPLREEGPVDAAPSGLYAGVARVDVAPPYGISQMSWGSAMHVESDGVDPVGMYAIALVLSDGAQKFVLIDADQGVGAADELIERASARTGIPPDHIRLGSTHTHASPGVSPGRIGRLGGIELDGYQEMLTRHRASVLDKIVGAVYEADTNLRPVHMYGGSGIGTININRQFRGLDGTPAVGLNPAGFVDPELVVFRIDDADGNPYAVLVNFQAHPTILAYANTKISPDYVGMTRRVIEDALPGATAMFLQGGAGNQGPVEGYTGDLGVSHRLGAILGHEAAAIALGIETVDRAPVFEGYVESTALQAKQHWRVAGPRDQTLRFETRVFEVPGRKVDDNEMRAVAERVADARRAVDSFDRNDQSAAAMQARARLRRYANLLDRYQGYNDRTEPVLIQLWALRVGDLAIVALPGEPFAQIGARIKENSPFAYTMFSGYSRFLGGIGAVGDSYIAMESDFDYDVDLGPTYELEWSLYGRGAAEEIVRVATEMLEELK